MAPKKQDKKEETKKPSVRESIRSAGSDGISRKEIQQIQKDTGASMQRIVQQLDNVNQNLKKAEQQTIALNSGAANMLIKEASKQPVSPIAQQYGLTSPAFGGGNIGKTLNQAIQARQAGAPSTGLPATSYIPGGMQIRSGGKLGVRPQIAPTVTTDTTTSTTPGLTEEQIQTMINDGITTGINDYISGLDTAYNQDDQAYLDMLNNMPNMFAQQMQGMFDPLQQAIDSLATQEPLRLYGAGQNYNVGGVRTNPRRPQGRSGFLRNNMGIGGSNVASGLTSGLSGLTGALGSLGGLTI
jgi:hypothetical protein